MQQIQVYLDRFDKELQKFPPLVELEVKTKIPKTYLVLGTAATLLLCTFLNWAGSLLSNFIGFAYPSYASYKAIETRHTSRDDTQWLTYWVVFGFFSIIEFWSDRLLSWFPFYFFVKSIILLWLYLPMTQGSLVVYEMFVRPTFIRLEGKSVELKAGFSAKQNKFAQSSIKESVQKTVNDAATRLEKAKSDLNGASSEDQGKSD